VRRTYNLVPLWSPVTARQHTLRRVRFLYRLGDFEIGYISKLSPCIDEIIGDHECGFRHNRSTTDQIFCIRQILDKKWEYNETVHQLFVDFKKDYDSVRREVL
jgi:hypothetical protein